MKCNRSLAGLLFVTICFSCSQSSETEKYQKERNNILQVGDRVKAIDIEDVLIGRRNVVYLMGDYWIINDYESHDEMIHFLDKNDFSYVTSIAYKGQGPGEIANIGHLGINENDRMFYVTDHGKNRIFSYSLDSVLANPSYMPETKMEIVEKLFPDRYRHIHDTLCIGVLIEPTGSYGFKQYMGKWNMNTGEIRVMPYAHPEIERKRGYFDVSVENDIYVESYSYHDLVTICTLDGELKYNIYGRRWNNETSNKTSYYGDVIFCRDKIIALYYDGMNTFHEDKNGAVKSNFPKKFIVFDLNGDYVQTLETGYQIRSFCYDESNNRILMSLEEDLEFAWLDLDGIL